MQPISPVLPGSEAVEVVYAKDQPEYVPLPTVHNDTMLVSRWRLTDAERNHIANGGDLFIFQMHFGDNLQPILPIAAAPEDVLQFFMNQTL